MKHIRALNVAGKTYSYYDLEVGTKDFNIDLKTLPYSIKILVENMLRNGQDISIFSNWKDHKGTTNIEILYKPIRVLMQDFTGVPAIVDLAAMRDAVGKGGGDPKVINPIAQTDLVIDHSVQVDDYGHTDSASKNVALEMQRNKERYEFLKWGQQSFDNFRVVPPGTGICHQVNLEYIAQVVWQDKKGDAEGRIFIYPDTCVGTDSHTTMVNGLGVLGWGVGGIEAESVMLGQSISMLLPQVVGFKMVGQLKEGVTATDLVLTVTQMLRKKGVVDKFVEFFGSGVKNLSLADRATIANMAPEYGATCGIFPVDQTTLNYLYLTGRDESVISITKAYLEAQGMFDSKNEPVFTDVLELDLASVVPSLSGPKRPQDRIDLTRVPASYRAAVIEDLQGKIIETPNLVLRPFVNDENDFAMLHSLHEDKATIALVGESTHDSTKRWLEMLVNQFKNHGIAQFCVVEKSSGKFVGKAGILPISEGVRKALDNSHIGSNEYSAFLMSEFIGKYEEELIKSVLEWYQDNYSTSLYAYAWDVEPIRNEIYSKMSQVAFAANGRKAYALKIVDRSSDLRNGSIVVAAITSCTNTSNPDVLIGAGLIAKRAIEMGLNVKPFVKTSLAPGSQVAADYLEKSGLQKYLDQLGFNIVGFGCTTCIGNSGPLKAEFERKIKDKNLYAAAVLSGNRNFEGRIHPLVKANYLASPMLVVIYAIAGHININLDTDPIAQTADGKNVYLKDLWPTQKEIAEVYSKFVTREVFSAKYANVYEGTPEWQQIKVSKSDTYNWDKNSTYIQNPPYFSKGAVDSQDIKNARALLVLGDDITTDHISPAGDIALGSSAAKYLEENGISKVDFNSYGARRGAHEVMMRGTFANIRLKNEMAKDESGNIKSGGYTVFVK